MNKSSKTDTLPDKILQEALQHAPTLGWSDRLVQHLNDTFGQTSIHRYYPKTLNDLVDRFALMTDKKMIEILQSQDIKSLKIRERIYNGVKARIESLAVHKPAFKASLKFMLHPKNALHLKKISWRTADTLWWAAGDTSTDYNHYTKRILLSGVFASTTLFWLKDTSKNNEKTWTFLEHRINNVLKIGGFFGKLKKRAQSI